MARTQRSFHFLIMLGSLLLAVGFFACTDLTPRDRSPERLAAFFSGLPVPDSAAVLSFHDDFAEGPAGRGQGTVGVTLQIDSVSFEAAMFAASQLGSFRPVKQFPISSKVASLLEAPDGIYSMDGDYWLNRDLVVLNPARRTLDVSHTRVSGMP